MAVLIACSMLNLAVLNPANAQQTSDSAAELIEAAIEDGQMAGAVVMLARGGETVYAKAFGDAQVEPERRPMRLDTVFDLASLTKPVATATSIMCLIDRGELTADTTIAAVLPEFGTHGKDVLTVEDLLLHRGGLIADNALSDYSDDPAATWQNICDLKPLAAPGERFIYSDVGFIVLGKVVEAVSGQGLDTFSQSAIFQPLGMDETQFNPPAELRQRAAATEKHKGEFLVGRVHDPRAARMGGVAGHAGLFSTAADLIRYGNAMGGKRDDGEGDDGDGDGDKASPQRLLSGEALAQMTRGRDVPRGTRGYGWDVRSPYSSNRAEGYSDEAFGHGGFTGTVLWIDPAEETVFVWLSNRLHPDGRGAVNRLAAQVADRLLEATQ
ncbi:serine hydrolase domain-containing protein [Roseimaritima sediminicola]|uniref:serine hydrolase domain-containing protein n=1 Tax=Roseimaritima sediminicola TaxID=2662066 RepID=UPI0013873FBE|nr:serine hydrolase domain-containing protein [Roseimaritima sediminicola]